MGSVDYEFHTIWRVAGSPDEVTAILGHAEAFPRWWPSVYLAVEPAPRALEDSLAPATPRSVLLHTKGWLPYTLRWTMTATEPVTNRGFALTAAGDLNGTGRWTFEQDGPETVITYDWRVSTAKPLLRRLSWLLKPAFAANHRWAMARGRESLALELRRRRHPGDTRSVPPPPPPTVPVPGAPEPCVTPLSVPGPSVPATCSRSRVCLSRRRSPDELQISNRPGARH